MNFELITKREGAVFNVALKGELDSTTAPELKDVLEGNLAETEVLCLNFAGCDYVASAGLRVLLNTYKSLKAKKGMMKFMNIGPNFTEVLNITGLDVVFGLK